MRHFVQDGHRIAKSYLFIKPIINTSKRFSITHDLKPKCLFNQLIGLQGVTKMLRLPAALIKVDIPECIRL